MSTVVEPRGNRILVEKVEPEAVSKGGVILPEQAQESQSRGTVKALGPLVNRSLHEGDRPLAIGDEILFSKYGGHEMKVDLTEVWLLREDDVFAIVSTTGEDVDACDLAADGEDDDGMELE